MLCTRLTNARFLTMDPAHPVAHDLGIWRGRIVGLDEAVTSLPAAEVVDLQGATVLPGFIDAHVHLAWTGFKQRTPEHRGPYPDRRRARRRGRGRRAEPARRLGERRRLRPAGPRPPSDRRRPGPGQPRTQGVPAARLRTRLRRQLRRPRAAARRPPARERLPRRGRHGCRPRAAPAALPARTGRRHRPRRPHLSGRGHHRLRRGGHRRHPLRRTARSSWAPTNSPAKRACCRCASSSWSPPTGCARSPRTAPTASRAPSTSACAPGSATTGSPWAR